jgi:hypothetical protein
MVNFNPKTGYWNLHINLGKLQNQGYGPLVYDIIMEYVSFYKNSMLVPSETNKHGITIESAQKIYKYYYFNRPDVKNINCLIFH